MTTPEPRVARWARDDSLDGWTLRDQFGKEHGFITDEWALNHPDRSWLRFVTMFNSEIAVNQALREEHKDG